MFEVNIFQLSRGQPSSNVLPSSNPILSPGAWRDFFFRPEAFLFF